MKIGILGGTFNPIHIGHLILGEYAKDRIPLDEVWYMPNGNPPHKQVEHKEIMPETRCAMVELAIQDYKNFKLCKHEIITKDISYSYKTIGELKNKYPQHEFYFIVGSDSLLCIDKWKNPKELLNLCTFVVACRENVDLELIDTKIELLQNLYRANIVRLDYPVCEVSSSKIRNNVSVGNSIENMVPSQVEAYINCHKLYI